MRRRTQKSNRIEKSSINITLDKIKGGDITLLVLDISEPLTFQDRHLTEHIVKSGNSYTAGRQQMGFSTRKR